MNDALRSAGYLPTTSPYSDDLTVNASVFTTTGANAIVDWVWVELRDATDNTVISASRSALLQRDGDVVDVDGTSALTISTPSKSFYVVINHRNHLAVMTKATIALTATPAIIDFTTTALATFGNNAQKDMGSGMFGLWSGDVNNDGIVQYSGTTPDTPIILSYVLNDSGNIFNFPTFASTGYSNNDVNMDASTQYTGTLPDTPAILQNVLAHPGNFLNFSTYQIIQQLP